MGPIEDLLGDDPVLKKQIAKTRKRLRASVPDKEWVGAADRAAKQRRLAKGNKRYTPPKQSQRW